MNESVQAVIRWLSPEEGGRTLLPVAPRYMTTARFEDSRDRWPIETWSLVIDFVRDLGTQPSVTLAQVFFLAPWAPKQFLSAGTRFEVCEGRRVVAKGVVLPAQVNVPASIDDFATALLG